MLPNPHAHSLLAAPLAAPSRRKRIKSLAPIALAGAILLLTGCNSAQTGALLGAALGSAAGAGIDHNNRGRGALIGAGVGAVAGYVVGNEVDKSQQQQGGYGYYRPEPTYYEPAPPGPPPPVYYQPAPPYYQTRVYYQSGPAYCPPPPPRRYYHHHHHHH